MTKKRMILKFKSGSQVHYVENMSNLHSNHLMIAIKDVVWNDVGEPTGFSFVDVGEPTSEDTVIVIDVGEPTMKGVDENVMTPAP